MEVFISLKDYKVLIIDLTSEVYHIFYLLAHLVFYYLMSSVDLF